MDPIPTWVRRLWDVWDLRVLVLLSSTLQIILYIFGNRRKYISSLWISVLVWSAYLTADWVATVALGKLSDAQGDHEKSNILWAIWAPMLLLHLGGPDSITAYSLEDNQLWMRHLMGLLFQLSVAIYVILMSWEHSWFSFMSLPALVAGIIKYGERTWVLKSVSDDNYMHAIPFDYLGDKYTTVGHEYVRVLILAHFHLKEFMIYLETEEYDGGVSRFPLVNIEDNILFDALEVQMGLMYDLLYTKAAKVYSKGGCILRCISFGCTVSVLVGLIFWIVHFKIMKEGDNDQGNWHEIDMAITGVLILGALALEIYAAIVIFSSNWGMLWLIKQGRGEWVVWFLNKRFQWFFNKGKSWSKMMGQFDLLGYCLKVREPNVRSLSKKIIWSVLGRDSEEKWNKYRHKNAYSVHPLVYNAILDYSKALRSSRISDIITGTDELVEFEAILEELNYIEGPLHAKILCLHLATKICYHLENEWDAGGDQDPSESSSSSTLWKQNKEVCKALSDYMMYLLVMHPSLLANDGASLDLKKHFDDPTFLIGDAQNENAACHYLLERNTDVWSRVAEDLKGKGKMKRWEIMKQIWWDLLGDATVDGFGQKNGHFQKLRQGGELLTLIWFLKFRYTSSY